MRLEISCQDRLGITQDILDILVDHEIDLRGIEIDGIGKIYLSFPTMDFTEFQDLMPKIRRIDGIDDVKTTAFMPGERARHQLSAILQTLPDPVFAIDTKGNLISCNNAAEASLELRQADLIGTEIADLVTGFSFTRWLDGKEVLPQSTRVKFIQQDYLADILPVTVPDGQSNPILAGGVIMLKSELRIGQQVNAFHRPSSDSFDLLVAQSTSMKKLVKEAKQIVDLEAPILIFGETGTGKELFAQACQQASRRADAPLESIKCISFTDDIVEAELFGQTEADGSAKGNEKGMLERVQGGTLLLDEIGDMSEHFQQVLLKVLEHGEYTRTGSEEATELDVRIICTTAKDLGLMVEEGRFSKALYYRLNVLSLVMPSLRERKPDIVALAETFIAQHSTKLGKRPAKLSKSCVDFLQQYPWPGNVRQLENALYRAVSLVDGHEITKEDVQLPSCAPTVTYIDENFEGTLDQEVKKFEKDLLRRLYPSYPSTRQLAKKLGLSHTAIANKLREYGINKGTVKI
ncbi:transcriptional regulator TyrR [Alteromonas sediminis]|uniref:HTH-type transcriptional regulatory protein TyrR n=1 Tax=Alteromonas sediminis TaxID=2259342 RepID=A0A3N5XW57_9ALTE|nr:transcriptional regulator TyrR [Alteromonas sediminis]RPJ65047.1 transcriptional regulator TyrR [Alteromonas sediminis]